MHINPGSSYEKPLNFKMILTGNPFFSICAPKHLIKSVFGLLGTWNYGECLQFGCAYNQRLVSFCTEAVWVSTSNINSSTSMHMRPGPMGLVCRQAPEGGTPLHAHRKCWVVLYGQTRRYNVSQTRLGHIYNSGQFRMIRINEGEYARYTINN